jgi:hypothetical protein
MAKTPTSKSIAGVSIENLKAMPKGVTMNPMGKSEPAPAKPSNKEPAVIKSQAKGVAKPAPAKPAAKVKSPDCKVTPYGMPC